MQELLAGIGAVLAYFVIGATAALLCRFLIRIPDELFRKILHCILLGSLIPFVFCFEIWWVSALTALGFAIVVYPVLAFFERFKAYSSMTTERKKGELKQSLLLVFGMFAGVIALCWGFMGDRWLVLASIYAWGFGDAAAALVGKRFGSHKIRWRLADEHKSYEGSGAMLLVSFLSVAVCLSLRGGLSPGYVVIISLVTALTSTLAELCSRGGMDTVVCPLTSMAVLIPMVTFLGGSL